MYFWLPFWTAHHPLPPAPLQRETTLSAAPSRRPGKLVCAERWNKRPQPPSPSNPHCFMSPIFMAKHGPPKHGTEKMISSKFSCNNNKQDRPASFMHALLLRRKANIIEPNLNRQTYTRAGNLIFCANGIHCRYKPRGVNYNPINNTSRLGSRFPLREKMRIGKRHSEY